MYLRQEYNLKTDPEFESLHVKADNGYFERLEKSIVENGIFHAFTVWQGILVDGYKRYRICRERHIPFPIRTLTFSARENAMIWICDQMLKRNDLSGELKKYYIGKKFLYVSKLNADGMPEEHPFHDILKHPNRRYHLADIIGSPFNLSYGTVLKYSQYASALDKIRIQDELIFEKIVSGKVKISHENTVDISNLAGDDMKILHDLFNEKNRIHISHSEIWHELKWSRMHLSSPETKKKETVMAPIKLMPAYDPDAEISSLALTIPSWIKSIERTVNNADFRSATDPAKHKLREQLTELRKAAEFLYSYTQEASHEFIR